MTQTKTFNLLKYVYGKLYEGTWNNNSVVAENWKVNSWIGILSWLKKNNYIYNYSIQKIDNTHKIIKYAFNNENTMYKPYLRAIKYNCEVLHPTTCYNIANLPTGIDAEFENSFKRSVEYINKKERIYR